LSFLANENAPSGTTFPAVIESSLEIHLASCVVEVITCQDRRSAESSVSCDLVQRKALVDVPTGLIEC
jgi:hypothetical protein